MEVMDLHSLVSKHYHPSSLYRTFPKILEYFQYPVLCSFCSVWSYFPSMSGKILFIMQSPGSNLTLSVKPLQDFTRIMHTIREASTLLRYTHPSCQITRNLWANTRCYSSSCAFHQDKKMENIVGSLNHNTELSQPAGMRSKVSRRYQSCTSL